MWAIIRDSVISWIQASINNAEKATDGILMKTYIYTKIPVRTYTVLRFTLKY